MKGIKLARWFMGCKVVRNTCLMAVFAAWAATAQAQGAPEARGVVRASPRFDACVRQNDSTPAREACAAGETRRWDERLNTAYRRVMASANWTAATKALLRDAQRAWVPYRNAKCAAQSELDYEGGTMSRIDYADCVMNETALRAVELEAALTPN